MQPLTLMTIEIFIMIELYKQLDKHNHRIANTARATALILIASHACTLILPHFTR